MYIKIYRYNNYTHIYLYILIITDISLYNFKFRIISLINISIFDNINIKIINY